MYCEIRCDRELKKFVKLFETKKVPKRTAKMRGRGAQGSHVEQS